MVRAGGSIAAFEVGTKAPADAGFVLVGAHTDSPNLRLKPHAGLDRASAIASCTSKFTAACLLSTWLDRDLSLAGRVVFGDGKAELVDLERAVCRIPNLAIHLNRDVNSQGLLLNAQTQLLPVLGLERDERRFSRICWRVLARHVVERRARRRRARVRSLLVRHAARRVRGEPRRIPALESARQFGVVPRRD